MLGTLQLERPVELTFSFSRRDSHPNDFGIASSTNTKYSVLEMDQAYQIEARDPLHHWAPELNKAKERYLASEEFKASGSVFSEAAFFGWVECNEPTLPKTQYLNPSELEGCRQTLIAPNQVIYQDGKKHSKSMKMFVMNVEGEFFVHQKVKPTTETLGFNHSCFFAGGQVAGVGFMHFNDNGELIAIDDYSGHYKPGTAQVLNVMHALKDKGFDLSKIDFYHRISPDSTKNIIYNAQAWYDENLSSMKEKPASLKL